MPKKAFAKINNTKIVKNALLNVSLPGEMGRREREEVNALIDESNGVCNFIVLFKGVLGRTDYRALYRFDEVEGMGTKMHGAASAPETIRAEMVANFYKYNSGSKEYMQMGQQRHLTSTTDGVSLKKEFQPATKKKALI